MSQLCIQVAIIPCRVNTAFHTASSYTMQMAAVHQTCHTLCCYIMSCHEGVFSKGTLQKYSLPGLKTDLFAVCWAAITSQDVCTSVGGTWTASTCQLLQQQVCRQSGGDWRPRKRASLEGGMDLLVVALMQVSRPAFRHSLLHILRIADVLYCSHSLLQIPPHCSSRSLVLFDVMIKEEFAVFCVLCVGQLIEVDVHIVAWPHATSRVYTCQPDRQLLQCYLVEVRCLV